MKSAYFFGLRFSPRAATHQSHRSLLKTLDANKIYYLTYFSHHLCVAHSHIAMGYRFFTQHVFYQLLFPGKGNFCFQCEVRHFNPISIDSFLSETGTQSMQIKKYIHENVIELDKEHQCFWLGRINF